MTAGGKALVIEFLDDPFESAIAELSPFGPSLVPIADEAGTSRRVDASLVRISKGCDAPVVWALSGPAVWLRQRGKPELCSWRRRLARFTP